MCCMSGQPINFHFGKKHPSIYISPLAHLSICYQSIYSVHLNIHIQCSLNSRTFTCLFVIVTRYVAPGIFDWTPLVSLKKDESKNQYIYTCLYCISSIDHTSTVSRASNAFMPYLFANAHADTLVIFSY